MGSAVAAALGLFFFHVLVPVIHIATNKYRKDTFRDDQGLTAMYANDAARLSGKPLKVRVASGPYGSSKIAVEKLSKELRVTDLAVRDLTPVEVRYLMASKGLARQPISVVTGFLMVIPLAVGLAYWANRLSPSDMTAPLILVGATAIGLAGVVVWTELDVARRQMHAGLSATLDKRAAVSVIEKTSRTATAYQRKTLQRRLALLSKVAENLGLGPI